MDNANYNLLTSQIGTFNTVTTIANNVANANTPGYKQDKMVFEKHLTKDLYDNNTMPLDRATIVDMKEGGLKQTNRELDFVISGDGLFMIQTPLGIRYTRAGTFTLNSNYEIVTPAGHHLLTENGDIITLNENDQNIMINNEGRLYARQSAQNEYEERGKLGIAFVENKKALRKAGDGNLLVEENAVVVQANPGTYKMLQGFVEDSNVVPIMSMTNLVELQHKSAEAVNLTKQIESSSVSLYRTLSRTE